jgi:hypothetical protein
LLSHIEAAPPAPGTTVYVERRGEAYGFARVGEDDVAPANFEPGAAGTPDAWLYFSGDWPAVPDQLAAMVDDLLEEMECMAGGGDRCRWSPDDPWPHH